MITDLKKLLEGVPHPSPSGFVVGDDGGAADIQQVQNWEYLWLVIREICRQMNATAGPFPDVPALMSTLFNADRELDLASAAGSVMKSLPSTAVRDSDGRVRIPDVDWTAVLKPGAAFHAKHSDEPVTVETFIVSLTFEVPAGADPGDPASDTLIVTRDVVRETAISYQAATLISSQLPEDVARVFQLASEINAALVDYSTSAELTSTLTNYATNTAVEAQIEALVGGAPGAWDTLKKIGDELAADNTLQANFVTELATLNSNIATLNSNIATLNAQSAARARTKSFVWEISVYGPTHFHSNLAAGELASNGAGLKIFAVGDMYEVPTANRSLDLMVNGVSIFTTGNLPNIFRHWTFTCRITRVNSTRLLTFVEWKLFDYNDWGLIDSKSVGNLPEVPSLDSSAVPISLLLNASNNGIYGWYATSEIIGGLNA